MSIKTKLICTLFAISILHHPLIKGEGITESTPLLLSEPAFHGVMTNPLRGDGFGAQFLTIIFSVIYAELNNLKYYYTPFINLEHNYDGDPDFIQKKETLINFIENFDLNRDPDLQNKVNANHVARYRENTVNHLILFFNNNFTACINSNALKRIKYIFKANKTKSTYFDCDRFNIAVHIRRPNPHDSRLDGADTPDELFLNIIQFLSEKYASENPIFHIYSQGDVNQFKLIYNSNDIVFHINESVEDTFTSLVLADVLVTSRSDFSYTAGMISDGIIYSIPYWYPVLPHWISWPPASI